jgi:predicted helicase
MARLAAATREAEAELLAGIDLDDSGSDVSSALVTWIMSELVARGGRSEPVLPPLPVARADPPPRIEVGRWNRALASLDPLLNSNQLETAADRWNEWMMAGDSIARGAYLAELFLAAYDRKKRKRRGVYYTPWPIIDYLVRSVDHILRLELEIPEGIASLRSGCERSPAIIDPACGVGLFLGRVLELAHEASGRRFVVESPHNHSASFRLRGFDVLPEAIDVAAIVLRRYLTAPAQCRQVLRYQSALTPEADTVVDAIRRGDTPLVILGNPPYANFGGANRDPWILEQMNHYRTGLHERKHNLHDDSLKFLRWSQYQVDRAGRGVVALIINHTFLEGLTHRTLRRSLLESFDQLYFYNLHGSRWRPGGELPGQRDENVFGIRSGVTLCLLVRAGKSRGEGRVMYAELRGTRHSKLARLAVEDVARTAWNPVPMTGASRSAAAPPHSFVARKPPPASNPIRAQTESMAYHDWPGLDEVFIQYVSGIQTKRDDWFTDLDHEMLAQRMDGHDSTSRGDPDGMRDRFDPTKLRPYMMAPFDLRWIYYEPHRLGRARYQVMRHLLGPNLALVFMRQSTNAGEYDHFLVTPHLVSDRVFHSGHGAPYAAPLYLKDGLISKGNFRDEFLDRLEKRIGLRYSESSEAADDAFGAREVLAYIYAVAWTPSYRRRHAKDLPRSFPRIPWPPDEASFRQLSAVGERLIGLHTGLPMNSERSGSTAMDDDGESWEIECGYPQFVEDTGTNWGSIHLSATRTLTRLPRPVWEKRVGGVVVVQRWLKQRRGRRLDGMDRQYFLELVQMLEMTLRLEQELEGFAEPWWGSD